MRPKRCPLRVSVPVPRASCSSGAVQAGRSVSVWAPRLNEPLLTVRGVRWQQAGLNALSLTVPSGDREGSVDRGRGEVERARVDRGRSGIGIRPGEGDRSAVIQGDSSRPCGDGTSDCGIARSGEGEAVAGSGDPAVDGEGARAEVEGGGSAERHSAVEGGGVSGSPGLRRGPGAACAGARQRECVSEG